MHLIYAGRRARCDVAGVAHLSPPSFFWSFHRFLHLSPVRVGQSHHSVVPPRSSLSTQCVVDTRILPGMAFWGRRMPPCLRSSDGVTRKACRYLITTSSELRVAIALTRAYLLRAFLSSPGSGSVGGERVGLDGAWALMRTCSYLFSVRSRVLLMLRAGPRDGKEAFASGFIAAMLFSGRKLLLLSA